MAQCFWYLFPSHYRCRSWSEVCGKGLTSCGLCGGVIRKAPRDTAFFKAFFISALLASHPLLHRSCLCRFNCQSNIFEGEKKEKKNCLRIEQTLKCVTYRLHSQYSRRVTTAIHMATAFLGHVRNRESYVWRSHANMTPYHTRNKRICGFLLFERAPGANLHLDLQHDGVTNKWLVKEPV